MLYYNQLSQKNNLQITYFKITINAGNIRQYNEHNNERIIKT